MVEKEPDQRIVRNQMRMKLRGRKNERERNKSMVDKRKWVNKISEDEALLKPYEGDHYSDEYEIPPNNSEELPRTKGQVKAHIAKWKENLAAAEVRVADWTKEGVKHAAEIMVADEECNYYNTNINEIDETDVDDYQKDEVAAEFAKQKKEWDDRQEQLAAAAAGLAVSDPNASGIASGVNASCKYEVNDNGVSAEGSQEFLESVLKADVAKAMGSPQ